MLDKVNITGFKCIHESLAVDFRRDLSILVGDNGAGKTTILEAIHLALTGLYRGEPIRRALSQSLFNSNDVQSFLNAAVQGDVSNPPCISIEVYMHSDNDSDNSIFSGANNSAGTSNCGFTFTVSFDDDYWTELQSLPAGSLQSIPVEYYDARWMTFAGATITPRQIPLRSVMVNPAGEWRASKAEDQATRILIDGLDEAQKMHLAQEARTFFDSWNGSSSLKKANESLASADIEGIGGIDIAANFGTIDSWKRDIVVRLDHVPYSHIGAGSQSIMQAGIALRKRRPEKTTILLFEEPENHLSHTNLNRLIRLITGGAEGRKAILSTHSSYVANVLGLENIQIVGRANSEVACSPLSELKPDTLNFFKKLPGYDTLRLVLSTAAVLVEGPSDELIVQLAYQQTHDGRLPIEEGIDVISVGSGFLRFLELAAAISKRTLVLTDNDGKPDAVARKYAAYADCSYIRISYAADVHQPNDPRGIDPDGKINWDTLEAELLRANGLDNLKQLLGRGDADDAELLKHMESHKTEVALALFDASNPVKIPEYISGGLSWLDGKQ